MEKLVILQLPPSTQVLNALRLCSYYAGYFYAGTKTRPDMVSVHTYEERFWRDFCDRSEAAPRRSLKWRLTYRIRVHAVSDSFSCGPIRPYSVNLALVIAYPASVALLYMQSSKYGGDNIIQINSSYVDERVHLLNLMILKEVGLPA